MLREREEVGRRDEGANATEVSMVTPPKHRAALDPRTYIPSTAIKGLLGGAMFLGAVYAALAEYGWGGPRIQDQESWRRIGMPLDAATSLRPALPPGRPNAVADFRALMAMLPTKGRDVDAWVRRDPRAAERFLGHWSAITRAGGYETGTTWRAGSKIMSREIDTVTLSGMAFRRLILDAARASDSAALRRYLTVWRGYLRVKLNVEGAMNQSDALSYRSTHVTTAFQIETVSRDPKVLRMAKEVLETPFPLGDWREDAKAFLTSEVGQSADAQSLHASLLHLPDRTFSLPEWQRSLYRETQGLSALTAAIQRYVSDSRQARLRALAAELVTMSSSRADRARFTQALIYQLGTGSYTYLNLSSLQAHDDSESEFMREMARNTGKRTAHKLEAGASRS